MIPVSTQLIHCCPTAASLLSASASYHNWLRTQQLAAKLAKTTMLVHAPRLRLGPKLQTQPNNLREHAPMMWQPACMQAPLPPHHRSSEPCTSTSRRRLERGTQALSILVLLCHLREACNPVAELLQGWVGIQEVGWNTCSTGSTRTALHEW